MKITPYPVTLLEEIPSEMKRGWILRVNGDIIDNVKSVTLHNPRFGLWAYGKSPAGSYDQWTFHENGGGGSVTIPYCIRKNLYVGVLDQNRPLQSISRILNVPRGFLEIGENHFETAIRETREEMNKDVQRVTELTGDPGNPNSAFFETWTPNEGVRFYSLQFLAEELEKGEGDSFVLNKKVVKAKTKDAEGIMGVRFIPWYVAARLGDMMTLSALSRLLAHLESQGNFIASFQ